MNLKLVAPISALSFVLLAGCGRETEQEVAVAEPAQTAAEPSVVNVQVGREVMPDGTVATAATEFEAGQPVYVSMNVAGATEATPVTVQWYGPGGEPVGYENKTLMPGEQRVNFVADNTYDWQAGTYRAEIWVDGQKMTEQTFDIGAGALTAGTDETG